MKGIKNTFENFISGINFYNKNYHQKDNQFFKKPFLIIFPGFFKMIKLLVILFVIKDTILFYKVQLVSYFAVRMVFVVHIKPQLLLLRCLKVSFELS